MDTKALRVDMQVSRIGAALAALALSGLVHTDAA